jgi:hypothetical protein
MCTGSYGSDPPRAGAPLRFGVDPEAAGSIGTVQSGAKPQDAAKDLAALRALRPRGKQMVLRLNRLFWADGASGIKRFRQAVARNDAAGFDSELQVRYHPAAGDEGNIAKWTAYVRHVVDVFGLDRHVVAMTITNEVNLDISKNTSDGAYAGATDALVKGIVAARAEADRIGRRDMRFGFTYAYRWNPSSDAAFWTAIGAANGRFRRALGFVGVDIYPGTFYPPAISPLSSAGQEMVKGIATVRRCFMPKAHLGARVPIWVTENGAQSGALGDDAGQAAALRDMVTSTIAVSRTYHVTDYRWFNLRDNVTGSPGVFDTTGLLHDDDSRKPAFAAYRSLVAAHGARRPVRAFAAAFHATRTIVSLEFDYANGDELRALPLLAIHHLRATFFVNSGLIGRTGHLTYDQLRAIQALGHEIGGGGLDHLRLDKLSAGRARREICDDRTNLLDQGLAVDAFAYPYGAADAQAEQIVQGCGYSSGRLASGIRGGGKPCFGCPYAESIPPANRFATRLPAGARSTTRVSRIVGAVQRAERHGGGWVQILIHHVCQSCDRYAITTADLARLLDWLSAERGVQVRSVRQILDARGPTVRITRPAGVWTGHGEVSIPVAFTAPAGVDRIRYFVDGHRVGVKRVAPWRLRWDSDSVGPGAHTIRAMLEDRSGNVVLSHRAIFVR